MASLPHGAIAMRFPAPGLVDRNFAADRPNQLWVADIGDLQ